MLMEHLIATLPERQVRMSDDHHRPVIYIHSSNISKYTSEHLYTCGLYMQLVLEAMATVVCLNKDYRPTRMFPEMANLLHFFPHSN